MKYLILGICFISILASNDSLALMRPPKVVRVSFQYLEACEAGPECKPISISRKVGEKVELALPNLSRTSVSIWDEENYKKLMKRTGTYKSIYRTGSSEAGKRREIVLPLSKLKDGNYRVWIVGDSVGGMLELHLKKE
ncbi:hypothetical protein KBK19_18905 [Microvirga sp. STR05]|uniref:DUF3244 domain-containing protein n=1 Tax=Hymenobacter duratus TaxID=2771356 RepID=A0ABR8JJU9_9BACT|nr:hypothetical protein [Hymenobacter duratus]MBD2717120.1 hypothetical protein [Hymenobacter duratus]MBR7952036.1 hypothetical protein [Microvirga sp. STR05]